MFHIAANLSYSLYFILSGIAGRDDTKPSDVFPVGGIVKGNLPCSGLMEFSLEADSIRSQDVRDGLSGNI